MVCVLQHICDQLLLNNSQADLSSSVTPESVTRRRHELKLLIEQLGAQKKLTDSSWEKTFYRVQPLQEWLFVPLGKTVISFWFEQLLPEELLNRVTSERGYLKWCLESTFLNDLLETWKETPQEEWVFLSNPPLQTMRTVVFFSPSTLRSLNKGRMMQRKIIECFLVIVIKLFIFWFIRVFRISPMLSTQRWVSCDLLYTSWNKIVWESTLA